MKKLICLKCKQVHSDKLDKKCPEFKGSDLHEFKNSDKYLRNKITLVLEDRKRLGLQGLVGGLNCIVINTEADKQKATVEEFLKYTALEVMEAFEDSDFRTVVMKTEGSAYFLIRSRKNNIILPINMLYR